MKYKDLVDVTALEWLFVQTLGPTLAPPSSAIPLAYSHSQGGASVSGSREEIKADATHGDTIIRIHVGTYLFTFKG